MLATTMALTGSLAQSVGNNHLWDAGWGWWMALVMIAFWAIVIWVVAALSGRTDRRGARGEDHLARAEVLLAERLSRGEIEAAEYHERLGTLR